MKHLKRLFVALLVVLVLAGCSGKSIVGKYKAIELNTAADGDLTETLAELDASGMMITLEVKEDGTAILDLFGNQAELTWDKKAFYQNGLESPYTYDGTKLTIDEDGDILVFERINEE